MRKKLQLCLKVERVCVIMETSKNKHLFNIEREGKMNELKEQAVQRETRAEPPAHPNYLKVAKCICNSKNRDGIVAMLSILVKERIY